MDEHTCDRCRWQPWETSVWLATATISFVLMAVIFINLMPSVASCTAPSKSPKVSSSPTSPQSASRDSSCASPSRHGLMPGK